MTSWAIDGARRSTSRPAGETTRRPLFAEELRLVEDADAGERAYQAVRDAVTLRYPDGADVPEFLLHVDGDEAWWRWSGEPFDDQTA